MKYGNLSGLYTVPFEAPLSYSYLHNVESINRILFLQHFNMLINKTLYGNMSIVWRFQNRLID